MGSKWYGSEGMGKEIVYNIFNKLVVLFVVYFRVKQIAGRRKIFQIK